jgi:hypothetical protein
MAVLHRHAALDLLVRTHGHLARVDTSNEDMYLQ